FASGAEAAKITEYTIPTSSSQTTDIVAGPDGRLWFTESIGYKLGAITTDGAFFEVPLAVSPMRIAVVPGRLLAFTTDYPHGIGFSTVDGTANVQPFASNPQSIAAGPDGRIWITDTTGTLTALHFLANAPQTSTFVLGGASQ